LVPGTVKLLHQKTKKKVNGDQEGCSLDLKLSPDESKLQLCTLSAYEGVCYCLPDYHRRFSQELKLLFQKSCLKLKSSTGSGFTGLTR